jgi:hypothetical protein
MATKTISIDLVAYEHLRKARLRPDESFSQVIRRAHWDQPKSTGAALLEALKDAPLPSKQTLVRWQKAQDADTPPENSWTK